MCVCVPMFCIFITVVPLYGSHLLALTMYKLFFALQLYGLLRQSIANFTLPSIPVSLKFCTKRAMSQELVHPMDSWEPTISLSGLCKVSEMKTSHRASLLSVHFLIITEEQSSPHTSRSGKLCCSEILLSNVQNEFVLRSH